MGNNWIDSIDSSLIIYIISWKVYTENISGCSCSRNISYGFELMLNQESAHNIFRLLQCRDLDQQRLKGVIFDHACSVNTYLMNREPRMWEYLRTLVDGAHWSAHKKATRGWDDHLSSTIFHKSQLYICRNNRVGGHLGCSSGFNSGEYKEYLHANFNSEGREQLHSRLVKLSPSFKQMNYYTFMNVHRVFYGFSNLKSKGII